MVSKYVFVYLTVPNNIPMVSTNQYICTRNVWECLSSCSFTCRLHCQILKFGNLFFLPISLLKKCSMVQFKYIFLIVHVTELFSYVIHNSCYIIFYLVLRSSFSLWSLSVSYFLGELYILKRWACFVIIYKKYFSRLAFVFWFFLRVLFLQNIYKFTNIVL